MNLSKDNQELGVEVRAILEHMTKEKEKAEKYQDLDEKLRKICVTVVPVQVGEEHQEPWRIWTKR